MIRLIISMATFIGVVGCASSAPQTTASGRGSVDAAKAAITVVADIETDSVIEVIDIPVVAKTATMAQRDEWICHTEQTTGTHRREKVCRRRSEIDASRSATHRTLREMDRRSSATANSD